MFENMPVKLKKGEIEKRIWGHRLYDEQTGIMVLLEFLCVLASRNFEEQVDESLSFNEKNYWLREYKAPKRVLLRSLIFNNPYIDEIFCNDHDVWDAWREKFCSDPNNKKVFPEKPDVNIEKLKKIFGTNVSSGESFWGFKKVVQIIRQAGINVESGKRWTSRFIFPWGQNCLFLDLSEKGETGDRRFFARTGELLFLMLSFATNRKKLSDLIKERLFNSGHNLDVICQEISSAGREEEMGEVPGSQGASCELPLEFFEKSRDRINILCDDLIVAFSLPIPAPDIVDHVSRIISLNLFCYYLEQSKFVLDKYRDVGTSDSKPIVILCEALQKDNSSVRYVSKELFKAHSQMSSEAISAYYKANSASVSSDETVEEAEEDEESQDSDDEELNEKKKYDSLPMILKSHRHHWGAKLHRALAKDCGLASKLCTRGYRYAPSDDLIETLTAILIDRKRLLRQDFLRKLYERYYIVFGEEEFSNITLENKRICPDNAELKENRQRFQSRLQSLGRLVSLSDGFEFVLNSYQTMRKDEEQNE